VHSIAEKSHKMMWEATKIPTIKSHVAQDINISNVVVNKPANPHKIRDCSFLYNSTFWVS
jgi:hypothetical protein